MSDLQPAHFLTSTSIPRFRTMNLVASGATLSGGTVNVLAQNGTYSPSTKYTILTTTNSNGLSGTFDKVTSNLAFFKPTLSYDATDVFLTLDLLNNGGGGGLGFSSVAQTRNQIAVATALDASPVTDPLVKALFNQTADGARQAFDALSGEVFGSVQNTQAGQTQFARSAMLEPGCARRRIQARPANWAHSPSADRNWLTHRAMANRPFRSRHLHWVSASRDLTFWAQGLGGWGHTDHGRQCCFGERAGSAGLSPLRRRCALRRHAARRPGGGLSALGSQCRCAVEQRGHRQRPARRLCGRPPRCAQRARRRLLLVRQHRHQPRHRVPRLHRSDPGALPRSFPGRCSAKSATA